MKTKIDYKKIDNIEIDGLDIEDYPDFSDAFIISADYDGVEMDEFQLDELNDDRDFVHDVALKYYFR